MKQVEPRLLSELMKNSKRSDRDFSRLLGVSQPTITRARHKLESEGFIREYTIVPAFEKLGYEVMAFWVIRYRRHQHRGKPVLREKWREWMAKHPGIIFASGVAGRTARNALMISLHRSYSDYTLFAKELVSDWSYITEHETMLVDLKGYMSRPITFRYLGEPSQLNRRSNHH
jgi:DNA-binding Lrp family transcriptional regulator